MFGNHRWLKIDPDDFNEGDMIWIQHKDGPEARVGYVVLKSPDGWSFMMNDSDIVFSVIDWYIAVLIDEEKEKE